MIENDMYDEELDCVYEEAVNLDDDDDEEEGENKEEHTADVKKEDEHETDSVAAVDDRPTVSGEFSRFVFIHSFDQHFSSTGLQQVKPQVEPAVNSIFENASVKKKLSNAFAKRHKCQKCNKNFYFPSDLKRHELIHSGIRPHKCLICLKSFNRKGTLMQHQQLAHVNKCSICQRAFIRNYELIMHLRTHHHPQQ